MAEPPFFSIIVVCYNAEKKIKPTINSILSQTFSDYEIIVKDGLSSDNTLNCIPQDDRINVYSMKDQGIYDAMNQALDMAHGRYVAFMNCGDVYAHDKVFEKIHELLADDKGSCIYGDYMRDNEKYVQTKNFTNFTIFRSPLCHQTVFFPITKIEKYDISYHVMSDYELEVRLFRKGIGFLHTDTIVCVYEGAGFSETPKGLAISEKERKMIREKYYNSFARLGYTIRYAMTFPKLRAMIRKNKLMRVLYLHIRNLYYKISK